MHKKKSMQVAKIFHIPYEINPALRAQPFIFSYHTVGSALYLGCHKCARAVL